MSFRDWRYRGLPTAPEDEAEMKMSGLTISKNETSNSQFFAPDHMVSFRIGKEPKLEVFLVHKDLACKYSPVFKEALNAEFYEGHAQTYTLEDVLPDVFRFVQQWFYLQKLTLIVHNEPMLEHPSDEHHIEKCCRQDLLLIKLWIFAEKFFIPQLQNVVIDHMTRIQWECGLMHWACFSCIYENTTVGSPLRRFAVDQSAWIGNPAVFAETPHAYPHEMLIDLITLFADLASDVERRNYAEVITAEVYYVNEASS